MDIKDLVKKSLIIASPVYRKLYFLENKISRVNEKIHNIKQILCNIYTLLKTKKSNDMLIYQTVNIIYTMLDVEQSPTLFSDHYEYWRIKKICAIVQHYGEGWFKDKTILELGAGHGDIGRVIASMGATVVFAEGRREHCDYLRYKFPKNDVYQVNLENEWPFAEGQKFDLVLHLGLLYHLDNFVFSLAKCTETTDNFVLETEVCDSDDEDFILKIDENQDNYDQSLIGHGSRPSGPYLEKLINSLGFAYEAIKDNRCNAHFHIYDWPITNTKDWQPGLRRFWFCKNARSIN